MEDRTIQQKNKMLLFVCSSNAEQALFASSFFNSQAQKSELAWISRARKISDELSNDELSSSDLIAAFAKDEQERELLQERCAQWKEKLQFWNSDPDQHAVQEQVERLVVSLIIKGGKRQTTPTEPSKCKQCAKPISQCKCSTKVQQMTPKKAEVISISLDRKGRGGKSVTVASGFSLDLAALENLAKKLKQSCGSGGTAKEGQIEIQGDHRTKLIAELAALGYKTKRVGG